MRKVWLGTAWCVLALGGWSAAHAGTLVLDALLPGKRLWFLATGTVTVRRWGVDFGTSPCQAA